MNILAADIGGTKVLLQISCNGNTLLETQYISADYATFDELLSRFIEGFSQPIASACFAVAGPVNGSTAQVTNLPWQLNADALQQKFSIEKIKLINDFQAVGYGVAVIPEDKIDVLQDGVKQTEGVCALIGAGTGLGEALMVWDRDHYQVLPTEGGHVDFAPCDELQLDLWRFMRLNSYRVTYECLVSGKGLVSIFEFLRERNPGLLSQKMKLAMDGNDAATVIAQFALETPDALANQALDLFIEIYGAQVGNHALNTLPYGGLYIAGGIAPKLIQRIKQGGFMSAFHDKAPMKALMPNFPVMIVMEPKVGLLGAQQVAMRLAAD